MFVSCLPKARKLNNRTLSDKADMTGRVCSCNDIINLADGRTLRGVIVYQLCLALQLLRDIILSFTGIIRKSSAIKDHSAASSPHPSPNDFYFCLLCFCIICRITRMTTTPVPLGKAITSLAIYCLFHKTM